MNTFFFAVLPYLAIVLAIFFGVYRYYRYRYTFSSLSTEMLEKRALFWGSVPWHYGIIAILLAHIIAAVIPTPWGLLLRNPTRLFVLEVVGIGLALYTLIGLVILIARRIFRRPATASTSSMDWLLLALLAAQVVAGIGIAVFRRWGSLWYLGVAVPWLQSLSVMQPDITLIVPLPMLVKIHIVNGFVLVLLYPFTRLVHIFTVPIPYLWRPYQVVVWNARLASSSVLGPRSSVFHHPAGKDPGTENHERPDPADDPPDPPIEPRTEDRGPRTGDDPPDPSIDPRPEARGPRPEDDPPDTPRRRFLQKISVWAGSLTAVFVVVPSVWFLLGLRKAPDVWRIVGRLTEFLPGTTTKISFVDSSPLPWSGVTAETAAWLRHERSGQLIAFSVSCTHLGCPVRWLADAELFMCPCHGGVFYKDGRVASGPPRRPLVQYPLRVRNGNVEILTSPLPITG